MGVIAEGILRGCQGLFTPVSLGYPLSVFNKKLYSQTNKQTLHFIECTLKKGCQHKKRCTVQRHANAMRNGNARGVGNTGRDC